MSTVFPTGIDTFTTKVDGVDVVNADDINNIQDSVTAIQSYIGYSGDVNLDGYPNFHSDSIQMTGATINGIYNFQLTKAPIGEPNVTILCAESTVDFNSATVIGKMANALNRPDVSYMTTSDRRFFVFSGNSASQIVKITGIPAGEGSSPSQFCVDPSGVFAYVPLGWSLFQVNIPQQTYKLIAGTGSSQGIAGDNGPAISGLFHNIEYTAVDSVGNVYLTDNIGYRIRKISNAGIVTTIMGDGTQGIGANGVLASGTRMWNMGDLGVDGTGSVYFTDSSNRVRKITPDGYVNTVAGTGITGFVLVNAYNGDGIPATGAGLSFANQASSASLNIRYSGDFYVADPGAGRIRYVNTSGIISTVIGSGTNTSYTTPIASTGVLALVSTRPVLYNNNLLFSMGTRGGIAFNYQPVSSLSSGIVSPQYFPRTLTTEYSNVDVTFISPYGGVLPTGNASIESYMTPYSMVTSTAYTNPQTSQNYILGFYTGTSNLTLIFRSSLNSIGYTGITLSANYWSVQ